jgi:hypothetical protein
MLIEMNRTEATIVMGLFGDPRATEALENLRTTDIITVAVATDRFVNAGLIEMDEMGPFVTFELEQAARKVFGEKVA